VYFELMRVSRIALTATLAFALVAATTSRSDAQLARSAKVAPPATLGIAFRGASVFGPGATLAWFDPMSLKMLPGRKAPLGGHTGSWAFSVDRSVLAVASCWDETGDATGIRFVNARSMRVRGDVRLAQYQCLNAVTWLRPRRVLAVARMPDDAKLLVVDPATRRVLRRVSVPAYPWAVAHSRDHLVLLYGGDDSFAPAQLVIADANGNVRSVSVERVLAGQVTEGQSSTDYNVRIVRPGMAVDPEGRAFLVPASGAVAEIDLATLAVSYHDLAHTSLLRRFLNWLTPTAGAKALDGQEREAAWVGDGRIVVSGSDYSTVRDTTGNPTTAATPAGTMLIDTRSWRAQMLDKGTSGFAAAAGLVIAEGGSYNEMDQRSFGPGLEAFALDGHKLWQLHAGEARWIDPAGVVGYVYDDQGQAEVVDLAIGEVVATLSRSGRQWPQLLVGQSSNW
jgi:hypothetical protein